MSALARLLGGREAGRWRGIGRSATRSGAARVAVIGNCQAASVAQAMRLLLPESDVAFLSIYAARRRKGQVLATDLADRDVVFVSALAETFGLEEDRRRLEERGIKVIPIPVVVFSAFHPDLVYVGEPDRTIRGEHVRSPIGPYNSALALYGFLAGLSVEATLRLFAEDVYARLGYFDVWQPAVDYLLKLGEEAGYAFASDVVRWSRRGAFMHSINHPKPFVMADIGRTLLAKAGIEPPDMNLDDLMEDDLQHQGAWPVYPSVGARFGASGSYVFTSRSRKDVPHLLAMSLRDFVTGSHELYRGRRPAELVCGRVQGWLDDQVLQRDLAAAGFL